jgi:predicted Zn-dependent protease
MSAYRLQDTKTGLTYFHKLLLQQPMNDTLNYFGGWLYYQNNMMDSAVLNFKKVEEMKSSHYQYKATYMKAVCLYLNGNKAESIAAFELIHHNKSGDYYIKSAKVLADKRLW